MLSCWLGDPILRFRQNSNGTIPIMPFIWRRPIPDNKFAFGLWRGAEECSFTNIGVYISISPFSVLTNLGSMAQRETVPSQKAATPGSAGQTETDSRPFDTPRPQRKFGKKINNTRRTSPNKLSRLRRRPHRVVQVKLSPTDDRFAFLSL